ncbi:HEPN domain-containing protein [Actinobacillus minor]|uniref:HEPN domain-containing protein n=1 Tax=Actinobacillus minor TaxID=51047 RepID=UPI0023F10A80|nr:HEPN domain-containing protein [Actinobacillus minor]MDD6911181.1 HEPN domain-containing protein [Actinobacillus minor]MDY4712482.1 HEPN domain-containing protein [Actinobacillus minor]
MNNLSNTEQLRTYFREQRDIQNFPDNFRLRIHRALSWLGNAENLKKPEELDMKFISLWISFNAAYARDFENHLGKDRATFNEFLLRICAFDKNKVIYNLVWKKFSQSIRLLLDNKYVFQPFWDFHNDKISEKDYLIAEMKERERFFSALEQQKTERILDVMFSRLYTLRNQILHGGATFDSRVNREQLKDGCNILSLLIPAMLQIMMENHSEIDWGKPFYPVVNA